MESPIMGTSHPRKIAVRAPIIKAASALGIALVSSGLNNKLTLSKCQASA
jgi:hypothetical protein